MIIAVSWLDFKVDASSWLVLSVAECDPDRWL